MAKGKKLTSFEDWHHHDVSKLLNVRPVEDSPLFQQWITVQPEIPSRWTDYVEFYRQDLALQYESWNETELLAHFIVPFMKTLLWYTEDFNLFNERKLQANVEGYPISGIVDGMVAKGSYEPEKPYFFLQEYKRMKKGDADPLGKLLIAMLAARVLNEDEDHKPLYGCHIIGSYWRFVLLEGDTYVQSQGYDATDKTEIQIIWGILKQTKNYIEIRVAEDLEAERLEGGKR